MTCIGLLQSRSAQTLELRLFCQTNCCLTIEVTSMLKSHFVVCVNNFLFPYKPETQTFRILLSHLYNICLIIFCWVEGILPIPTTWNSDLPLLNTFPHRKSDFNFLPCLKHKLAGAALAKQLKTQKQAT